MGEGGRGGLPRQRPGPRWRHATASWAYLLRFIKLLSSSSSTGKGREARLGKHKESQRSHRSPSGSAGQADTSDCHPKLDRSRTHCPKHSGVDRRRTTYSVEFVNLFRSQIEKSMALIEQEVVMLDRLERGGDEPLTADNVDQVQRLLQVREPSRQILLWSTSQR